VFAQVIGADGAAPAAICEGERAVTEQIDIGGLNFGELSSLRGRIDDRVKEMRETGAPALRERFMQEAAALGLTIEEIVQAGAKRRGRAPNREVEGQAKDRALDPMRIRVAA
jgi:hypothetical protein